MRWIIDGSRVTGSLSMVAWWGGIVRQVILPAYLIRAEAKVGIDAPPAGMQGGVLRLDSFAGMQVPHSSFIDGQTSRVHWMMGVIFQPRSRGFPRSGSGPPFTAGDRGVNHTLFTPVHGGSRCSASASPAQAQRREAPRTGLGTIKNKGVSGP